MPGMNAMHALDGFSCFCRSIDVIDDVNATNHKHIIFRLDLTSHVSRQMFIAGVDLTRFQRATEGADQSTTGGGNYVIKRCRMWFGHFRTDAVMFRDSAMHSEFDGFSFGWQVCHAQRPNLALDSYVRDISDVRHIAPYLVIHS